MQSAKAISNSLILCRKVKNKYIHLSEEKRCSLALSVEKAMVTHSSTLAWTIAWKEEPGELQSMGLLRVGHD